MLAAPALMVLIALYPQSGATDHVKQELKNWKPGPNVARELARLDSEGRAVYKAFRDGKLAQLTLIRELARVKTTMEALRIWSFVNHSDEVPRLVVVIGSDEYVQVFPRGTKHLPSELVAGEVYAATPTSGTKWQYLGERQVTGLHLSIFRYLSSELTAASAAPN